MKNLLIVYSVFFLTASQAFAFSFDRSVSPETQAQITSDLKIAFSAEGKAASPLHRQIFGEIKGSDYEKYFSDRIHKISAMDCGGGKGVVACVAPGFFGYGADIMYITKNYLTYDMPQVTRISVVYHEARHTEGKHGFWPHVNCPKPFLDDQGDPVKSIISGVDLSGLPACDKTAMGSYGSATIMLLNLAKSCTSCTEKLKTDAEMYGLDQLKRIVDKQALELIRADIK